MYVALLAVYFFPLYSFFYSVMTRAQRGEGGVCGTVYPNNVSWSKASFQPFLFWNYSSLFLSFFKGGRRGGRNKVSAGAGRSHSSGTTLLFGYFLFDSYLCFDELGQHAADSCAP